MAPSITMSYEERTIFTNSVYLQLKGERRVPDGMSTEYRKLLRHVVDFLTASNPIVAKRFSSVETAELDQYEQQWVSDMVRAVAETGFELGYGSLIDPNTPDLQRLLIELQERGVEFDRTPR